MRPLLACLLCAHLSQGYENQSSIVPQAPPGTYEGDLRILKKTCGKESRRFCTGIEDGLPLCDCLCIHESALYSEGCSSWLSLFMRRYHGRGGIQNWWIFPNFLIAGLGFVFLLCCIASLRDRFPNPSFDRPSRRHRHYVPLQEFSFQEVDVPPDTAPSFVIAVNPGGEMIQIAIPQGKTSSMLQHAQTNVKDEGHEADPNESADSQTINRV